MRTLFFLLSLGLSSYAQTTSYPAALDTDSSLFVVGDNVQSFLMTAMLAGDNVAIVASSTGFAANQIVTICETRASSGKCTAFEHMKVTAVNGNVLTVTRGFAGTSAAAHAANKSVSVAIDAAHQKVLKDATVAIETLVGANGSGMRGGINNTGRSGVTTVYPPATANGPGIAVKPDGTLISCAGTTTACLQEAHDYAWNNGTDLHIVGGLDPVNCGGCVGPTGAAVDYFFTAGAQLHIRGRQGGHIWTDALSIICDTSSACIWFDSLVYGSVEMYGAQVVNTGPCYLFNPAETVTGASFTFSTIGVSKYDLGSCTTTSTTAAAVEITWASSNQGIGGSEFSFKEINGGKGGIKINDSPGGGLSFQGNTIRCHSIHGQHGTVPTVMVGTSSTNQALINSNIFDLVLLSGTTGHGADIWGSYNTITLSDVSGTHDYAAYFEASACGNVLLAQELTGTVTLQNGQSLGGAGMVCTQVTGNPAAPSSGSIVLVSATPYMNLDGQTETIVIGGGTVSQIAICSTAASCSDTGRTAGDFTLRPGMGLKVTFSVAPGVQVKIL